MLSPLIGPEFDEFLGAPIGEDRNGTGLSVLSALARLDVDPWQEATSLARMPREAAGRRSGASLAFATVRFPPAPASRGNAPTFGAPLVPMKVRPGVGTGSRSKIRTSGDVRLA